jgi:hypothetical protein
LWEFLFRIISQINWSRCSWFISNKQRSIIWRSCNIRKSVVYLWEWVYGSFLHALIIPLRTVGHNLSFLALKKRFLLYLMKILSRSLCRNQILSNLE